MICRLVSGIPGPKSLSQVAAECGENLTEAIIHALEERLARLIVRGTTTDVAEEIMKISLRCKALPDMVNAVPTRSSTMMKTGSHNNGS